MTQQFYETIDLLASQIEQATNVPEADIYFACASFKDESSRRSQNATWMKSFWLDIDCGEGKPYATADDGVQALDEFANRLNLPLPLCVHSGRGVHAYWPLTHRVAAAQWAESSKLLKRATEIFGLAADPSRTADASSILRPPGTFNFKRDVPENVTVIEGDEPECISYEEFRALLDRQVSIAHSPIVATALSKITHGVNANILGGYKSSAPSMTQGYGDGDRTQELAKRAGYLLARGYGVEDVLAQCRAWNEFNTPPKDDASLEHDVRSYARREAEKKAAVASAPAVAQGASPANRSRAYSFEAIGSLEMPFYDGDGAEGLSPHTLYVADVCRRESEDRMSYLFNHWHPHNSWHEFALGAGEMEGPAWKSIAADNCAIVTSKMFKTYVEHTVIELKGQRMDATQYEQFGWKNDDSAFLIGNALIKNDGTATFAYGDKSLTPRMKAMTLAKNGSLATWTAAANKLFAPGYEAHGFALVAGMAAPLLRFLVGATDGGAILSLFSEGSGFGKSKILESIGSVWGKHDALSTAGKDTDNAKFQIISRACHLPVFEEELGRRDPLIDAEFVKGFTMGRDKNRSSRDGSVAYKNTRYQTILISASNRSLYENLKLSGDRGAVARVFEITMDLPAGDDFKYFNQVADEMVANCGYAGRALIAALLAPGTLDWVRQALRIAEAEYIKRLETQPEHRFVVWIMAAANVVGQLLNAANILNFNVPRVMAWAEERAKRRVEDVVGMSPITLLSAYINESQAECLTVEKEFHPKQAALVLRYPNRRLSMRMEKVPQKLFIAIDPLKQWLRDKYADYNSMLNGLQAMGVIINSRRLTTLGAGTDLPPGRVPCWEVDTSHREMGGMVQLSIVQPETTVAKAQ